MDTPTPDPTANPGASRGKTARVGERLSITGQATLTTPKGAVVQGRLFDISHHGLCVVMDTPINIMDSYALECIFSHKEQEHHLLVNAVAVYRVSMGRGYRVGFQFGSVSLAATAILAEVLR